MLPPLLHNPPPPNSWGHHAASAAPFNTLASPPWIYTRRLADAYARESTPFHVGYAVASLLNALHDGEYERGEAARARIALRRADLRSLSIGVGGLAYADTRVQAAFNTTHPAHPTQPRGGPTRPTDRAGDYGRPFDARYDFGAPLPASRTRNEGEGEGWGIHEPERTLTAACACGGHDAALCTLAAESFAPRRRTRGALRVWAEDEAWRALARVLAGENGNGGRGGGDGQSDDSDRDDDLDDRALLGDTPPALLSPHEIAQRICTCPDAPDVPDIPDARGGPSDTDEHAGRTLDALALAPCGLHGPAAPTLPADWAAALAAAPFTIDIPAGARPPAGMRAPPPSPAAEDPDPTAALTLDEVAAARAADDADTRAQTPQGQRIAQQGRARTATWPTAFGAPNFALDSAPLASGFAPASFPRGFGFESFRASLVGRTAAPVCAPALGPDLAPTPPSTNLKPNPTSNLPSPPSTPAIPHIAWSSLAPSPAKLAAAARHLLHLDENATAARALVRAVAFAASTAEAGQGRIALAVAGTRMARCVAVDVNVVAVELAPLRGGEWLSGSVFEESEEGEGETPETETAEQQQPQQPQQPQRPQPQPHQTRQTHLPPTPASSRSSRSASGRSARSSYFPALAAPTDLRALLASHDVWDRVPHDLLDIPGWPFPHPPAEEALAALLLDECLSVNEVYWARAARAAAANLPSGASCRRHAQSAETGVSKPNPAPAAKPIPPPLPSPESLPHTPALAPLSVHAVGDITADLCLPSPMVGGLPTSPAAGASALTRPFESPALPLAPTTALTAEGAACGLEFFPPIHGKSSPGTSVSTGVSGSASPQTSQGSRKPSVGVSSGSDQSSASSPSGTSPAPSCTSSFGQSVASPDPNAAASTTMPAPATAPAIIAPTPILHHSTRPSPGLGLAVPPPPQPHLEVLVSPDADTSDSVDALGLPRAPSALSFQGTHEQPSPMAAASRGCRTMPGTPCGLQPSTGAFGAPPAPPAPGVVSLPPSLLSTPTTSPQSACIDLGSDVEDATKWEHEWDQGHPTPESHVDNHVDRDLDLAWPPPRSLPIWPPPSAPPSLPPSPPLPPSPAPLIPPACTASLCVRTLAARAVPDAHTLQRLYDVLLAGIYALGGRPRSECLATAPIGAPRGPMADEVRSIARNVRRERRARRAREEQQAREAEREAEVRSKSERPGVKIAAPKPDPNLPPTPESSRSPTSPSRFAGLVRWWMGAAPPAPPNSPTTPTAPLTAPPTRRPSSSTLAPPQLVPPCVTPESAHKMPLEGGLVDELRWALRSPPATLRIKPALVRFPPHQRGSAGVRTTAAAPVTDPLLEESERDGESESEEHTAAEYEPVLAALERTGIVVVGVHPAFMDALVREVGGVLV